MNFTFDKSQISDLALREQSAEILIACNAAVEAADKAAEDEDVSETAYNALVAKADALWDQYQDIPISGCRERADGSPMRCLISGVPILVDDQAFLHEEADEGILRIALGLPLHVEPVDENEMEDAE